MLDHEGVIAHIASDSPGNGAAVLSRLSARVSSLVAAPGRGCVVPELLHAGLSLWRELIVKPYRIVYRVDARKVYVLAVFDGRRDLEDLLLERLVR